MKLNCDMGEGASIDESADAEIMPFVDMSNIACGFHASNPQIMAHTIDLAIKHNVVIGAHPGYPDFENFGRQEMVFTPADLVNIILYQIGALQALCNAKDTNISYVKPHGSLYNMMMQDITIYKALLTAIGRFSQKIPLVIMASPDYQRYIDIAQEFDIPIVFEAFCDRAYTDAGLLQPRAEEGAVFNDVTMIVAQAEKIIRDQQVKTYTGKILSIKADTICIHGDNSLALESVKRIRFLLSSQ